MPGTARERRGDVAPVGAGVEDETSVGDPGRQLDDRAAAAARHRQRRRVDAGERGRGREHVAHRAAVDGQRRARRGDDAPGDGARAGDGDLLADDGPHGCLERVDAARHAAARHGGDRRRQRRVLAERGVDGDGVGVEVEQAADAPHGRAEVAPVGEPQAHPHVRPAGATRAGGEGENGDAVAVREVERAVVRLAVPGLDAGHGAGGEERHEVLGVERLADGEIEVDDAGAPSVARGRPRRASADGVAANTTRTVSLNWRTLPNPAAKAMDVKSMSVVSMRMRAVWARWARAMASGPAPSSSVRSRVRCRSL